MPTQLTISAAEVLRLARLDAGVAQNATDAAAVLTDEQEAIEATLEPAAFAQTGITALLRRNVAKLLAAELLEMRGREEGASGSFEGLGIRIAAVPDHVKRLRDEARLALSRYNRAPVAVVPVVSGAVTLAPVQVVGSDSPLSVRSQAQTLRCEERW
ncbi:MAG: hypothetical protein H7Y38_08900 [Armatimonadetes bacterium]|nr:hypothetical protein [Armatimonadota bacterium]